MLNPKTGKKWKLYIGIPSTGTINDFIPFVMRDLQDRYGDEVEFIYPPSLCQRIFHDAARNGIVEEFMESGADILWMLDSDVSPPKHVLDLITMHGDKWEAAGAPYPVFMKMPGSTHRELIFTVYKGVREDGKGLMPAPIPFSGVDFVDGIATGCLFVKREVFEKLKRPYFEFKFDPIKRTPIEGEDLGFCLKLHSLGIQFFIDYSMVCKHTKTLCLLELNNYAITFANKSVERYDAEVRGKIMQLAEEINRLRAQLKEKESEKASSLIMAPSALLKPTASVNRELVKHINARQ